MRKWFVASAVFVGLFVALLMTYPKNQFAAVDRKLLSEQSLSVTLDPYVQEFHQNRNRYPSSFKELTQVYPEIGGFLHDRGIRMEDVQFTRSESGKVSVTFR